MSRILLLSFLLLSTLPTVGASEENEHRVFTYQTGVAGGWGTRVPTNYDNTYCGIYARTSHPSKPEGWYQSAEGFYQEWFVNMHVRFLEENVDNFTISFWVPESSSIHSWSVSVNNFNDPVSPPAPIVEGWNTWTFTPQDNYGYMSTQTGEYFDKEARIGYNFVIMAPPTLSIGVYDLFKIRMETTGDFEGVERFNYPGGKDTLVIQFRVGDTYDISVDEAFISHIWTTDQDGTPQDTFNIGEPVYLSGEVLYIYLPHISQVPLYIVKSRDWQGYDSIIGFERFGEESIEIINQKPFENRLIWGTPLPGSYDVIVDVDRDGVYTAGFDAVCNLRTRDFFVVPELPLGTLTALVTMASAVLMKRRKHHGGVK